MQMDNSNYNWSQRYDNLKEDPKFFKSIIKTYSLRRELRLDSANKTGAFKKNPKLYKKKLKVRHELIKQKYEFKQNSDIRIENESGDYLPEMTNDTKI